MPQQGRNGPDFLQLIIGLAGLKQQQQAEQNRATQAERQGKIAGFQGLLELARNAKDPTQLISWARIGEKMGIGSIADLNEAFARIQASPEVLKGAAIERGLNSANGFPTDIPLTPEAEGIYKDTAVNLLTGENAGQRSTSHFVSDLIGGFRKTATPAAMGELSTAAATKAGAGMSPQDLSMNMLGKEVLDNFRSSASPSAKAVLGNAMAARGLTGLAPGGLAEDTAKANLPATVLRQGAEISQGGVSPTQKAQLDLGYVQNATQQQLGILNAQIDQAKLLMAKGNAGQLTANDIPRLMENATNLIKELNNGAKSGYSDFQVRQLQNAIFGVNKQLNALGVATPNFDPNDASLVFRHWWNQGSNDQKKTPPVTNNYLNK